MNEIAWELQQIRKAKEDPTPVYVETEVKLTLEQEDRDVMQGLLAQSARRNELLAAQNDLLAELALDWQPRPRTAVDRIPDIIMIIIIVLLFLSLGADLARAIW